MADLSTIGIPPEATRRLIQRRLKVFGCKSIPSQSTAQAIYVLLKNNGEFWTISYLKSCSEKLKSLLTLTDTPLDTWVASKHGIPKIFENILSKEDVKTVSGRELILRLTSLHKAIKPVKVRSSDLIKLRSAIRRPPVDYPKQQISSLIRLGVSTMAGYTGPKRVRARSIFEFCSSFDQNDQNFFEVVRGAWSSKYTSLLATHERPYWPFSSPELFGVIPEFGESTIQVAGNIGVTPEPGGKVRLFASPNPIVGWLCLPLFQMSRKVLRLVPEDCTYNQEAFKNRLLKWLSAKKVVSSIDQSKATDLFPLEIIGEVAIALGLPSGAVEEFMEISRLDYRVAKRHRALTDDSMLLRWESGQPLGVFPSFNLYALAHHALVRGLFKKLGKPMNYVLLGDDIAICDVEVAEQYVDLLHLIGCEVNKAKSYTSSVYAEGAGFRCHAELAVCPGRYPIPDEFNFQSFIKDPQLRTEVLVNLPGGSSIFKDDGSLTRYTVYRILALSMENDDFAGALRFFTCRQIPKFKSPSTLYPENFEGFERKADEKFIFPLVDTLREMYGKASKGLKPVISRLITEVPQTSEVWIKDDSSLLETVKGLPLFRDFRKIDPLTMTQGELAAFGFQWKAPKGDTELFPLPRWAIELQEKYSIYAESLAIRKESLMSLLRFSSNALDLFGRDALLSEISQLEKEESLLEWDPNDPYKAWWSDIPNQDDIQPGDKVSFGKRLLVLELCSLFIDLLQSNGGIQTKTTKASFRSYYRKLNNCLKFSGFKTLLLQYMV